MFPANIKLRMVYDDITVQILEWLSLNELYTRQDICSIYMSDHARNNFNLVVYIYSTL